MLNVLDASFNVAHDYPGGVPALAARMDTSANVLNKKVDPTVDTHHLRLDEAVKITVFSKDLRILQAWAASVNCAVTPLPELENEADMSLLDGFMSVIKELGDFSSDFQAAWADGEITSKEKELLKARAQKIQSRIVGFVMKIESLAA